MANGAEPLVVGPGEGQAIQGPAGGTLTFKARGVQTTGGLTLFENVVAPGDGPPLHVHASEDESWFVLEGTLRFELDGEPHRAPEQTFVFVPRGTAHRFQNVAETPARILVWFTPAGMESFFDRFAELPPAEAGPDAFRRLGADAGMTVLGPPLGAP
jgi:quercetin dioxygenase-like cupin family protein